MRGTCQIFRAGLRVFARVKGPRRTLRRLAGAALAAALWGCASAPKEEVVFEPLTAETVELIGEENLTRRQFYIEGEVELAPAVQEGGGRAKRLVLAPHTKGIALSCRRDSDGALRLVLCFDSDNGKSLEFVQGGGAQGGQDGKFYLAYLNGSVIRYGEGEYKIAYKYRGGEGPYLVITSRSEVLRLKGRSVSRAAPGGGAGNGVS